MGLKDSKKYAIGSIYENGGGKFEISERWFDEETDTIMLKYKFIESGKVETNKEVNVTASEWKWRKIRGLAGKKEAQHGEEEASISDKFHWEELVEGLYVMLNNLIDENRSGVNQIKESVFDNQKLMLEMMSMIKVQQKQIEALVNDRTVVNKLLAKI